MNKSLAQQIFDKDRKDYGEEEAIRSMIHILDTVLKHDKDLKQFYKEVYGIK